MQAAVVTAGQGARWVANGWRLFAAAPFSWLGLVLFYWLLVTLVSLLPYVGVAAAAILVPGFSAGFMAAARAASLGERLRVGHLFAGFQSNARAMLWLGCIYLALLAIILGCSALADGGALAGWMLGGARPSAETLASAGFFTALLIAAVLYVPIMMLYWFAPVLAAWHSAGAAQALFYSFVACLMNWAAFLGYGAAVALIAFVVPFLGLSLGMLLTQGAPAAAASFLFPLLLVLLPVLFASFYASYRDVFGDPQAGAAAPTPPNEP